MPVRTVTHNTRKSSGPAQRAPAAGARRGQSMLRARPLEAGSAKKRARSAAAPPITPPPGRKAAVPRRKAPPVAVEPAHFIPPMKALSVDSVPAGEWRLEVKLDGYRAVAVLNHGRAELWSRNHKTLTAAYPEVVAALETMPCVNAVLDGEIVALDPAGRSRFQLLQGRGQPGTRPAIVYYVFDLLHHDGQSLLRTPIEARQRALEKLVRGTTGTIRFSPSFDAEPHDLLEAVRQQGLEGIIAKAPGSFYEPDRRSGAWLKCKVHGEQEFVIGGFTPPRNSRPYFGAILVGYHQGRNLMYAGKVGSGFDHSRLKSLFDKFQRRRVEGCPFANLPARRPRFGGGMTRGAMRQVTWIKPELVCQVRFTEWTDDGMLRHPVFLGLRQDKSARAVVREAAPIAGREA